MRTLAAEKMLRLGKRQTQIAKESRVSQPLVSVYLAGKGRPSPKVRQVFLDLYGIPCEEWDVVSDPDAYVPPPLVVRSMPAAFAVNIQHSPDPTPLEPAGPVETMSVIMKARELDAMAHAMIVELRNGNSYTALEKARVMSQIATTLGLVAKLLGQFDTGKHFLKLPIWHRIVAELNDSLKAHPEAAASVAERFEKIAAEES